jgi:hypothetical protein
VAGLRRIYICVSDSGLLTLNSSFLFWTHPYSSWDFLPFVLDSSSLFIHSSLEGFSRTAATDKNFDNHAAFSEGRASLSQPASI